MTTSKKCTHCSLIKPNDEYYEGYAYCKDCRKQQMSKYNKTPEFRKSLRKYQTSNHFKQNIQPKHQRPRLSAKVLEEVDKRDGHWCIDCGTEFNLQHHHIKPYKQAPNEYQNADNVINLCKDCHMKAHDNAPRFSVNEEMQAEYIKYIKFTKTLTEDTVETKQETETN